MNVHLNIDKHLKNQFEHYFKLKEIKGEYFLNASVGGGQSMEFVDFPGRMSFYHFKKSYFKTPIQMKSVNPVNSEWFLLHINLSNTKQQKKTSDKVINFQKHLPIGLLLYGAGLEIDTLIPANVEVELATIHFHRSFLDTYFNNWKSIIDSSKNLVYEDLDSKLENVLQKALVSIRNKIDCHANVLKFMSLYFNKLSSHAKTTYPINLFSEDVTKLFAASTLLRNPLATVVPTIQELASRCNMSPTKFKTSFKQVFGSAPFQYRNKIRMEFAQEELLAKRKTPTELSYDLGYAHPSNFTSAYKKYFKALPSSIV
ncbi:MAG: AraC family transcriptional regulator [Cellulophaga sp.]